MKLNNKEDFLEECKKFICRINDYIIEDNKIVKLNIDIKDIDDINIIIIALKKAIFNSPECVKNFFIKAIAIYNNNDIDKNLDYKFLADFSLNSCKIWNIINNLNNKNIYLKDSYIIFHPYINITGIKDLSKHLAMLFIKMFSNYDINFNSKHNEKLLDKSIINNFSSNNFITTLCAKGCVISGSIGLSYYGTIYRNYIKDIDLVCPYNFLSQEIRNKLDYDITNNPIANKKKKELENEISVLFLKTRFAQDIIKQFSNIEFVRICIDRNSVYDDTIKCTYTIKYDNIEYDLLFRTNISYSQYKNLKIQSLYDLIYIKKLLGRHKDFIDLINFKLYN